MAAYIVRRLISVLLVLVAVSMLVFAISAILPANVAYLILGPFAPPDQVLALEIRLGLNDPIWEQYWRWASRFVTGDLGQSTLMNRLTNANVHERLLSKASANAKSCG